MFESKLISGSVLKKVVDAVKDLVTEANIEVNSSGMSLQSMDSSHVSLTSLNLRADAFEHWRADRPLSMGVKLEHLHKMLKCCGNDDAVTMRATDSADNISLVFESPDQERISAFNLRLLDIDSEQLGIPDSQFDATVKMPSSEFQRICRDLSAIGDTVTVSVTKDGVKFSASGDIGSAEITCRQSSSVEKEDVTIHLDEPVSLTFALRYFNSFAKATPLSSTVCLQLSKQLPIVVDYAIESMGHLKFFLAPKMEDDEEAAGEN